MAVASSDIGVLDMRHKRCVKRRESQPVIKVRVRCLEAGRSRSRRQEGGPMCESHCSALRSSGHAMQSASKAATKSALRSGMQSDPFFVCPQSPVSCKLLLALACSCLLLLLLRLADVRSHSLPQQESQDTRPVRCVSSPSRQRRCPLGVWHALCIAAHELLRLPRLCARIAAH